MSWAPIAVFVYNRPGHTRKTLEALINCQGFEKSPVHVFSDGPRKPDDAPDVEAVRATARSILGDRAVYHEAEANKGLARSIIDGVTMVLKEYGRIIVIEDDLSVSPNVLIYLNAGLEKYETDSRVMQISAHMFPVPELEREQQALFLPFTTSWGWATWQDAWQHFDEDAKGWKDLVWDKKKRSKFDLEGAVPYFSMLKSQMSGQLDSWAIRWYWSVFRSGGLVLFPPVSYVRNTGFDGSGTHGWRAAKAALCRSGLLQASDIRMPREIRVVPRQFEAVRRVIKKMNAGRLNRLKRMLEPIRQRWFG